MKVAVITGAASGIGLALSLVCLRRGFAVVMADKDNDRLKAQACDLTNQFPGQVSSMACDITKATDVQHLLESTDKQWGRVDWLFNNAGIIGTLAPVWELSAEQIHQVIDVNLYGMINMIRIFSPYLFNQDFNSRIINMASLYALCSGSQMSAYSMSKHAVLSLSESLHYDLVRLEKPVNVSVVFPSFTDTSLLANKSSDANPAFHDSLNSLLAHSRPALDVAEHIVLETEQNRFYILPDKEVKGYCEERTKSILMQEHPHVNNIEKLMSSLIKRRVRSSK